MNEGEIYDKIKNEKELTFWTIRDYEKYKPSRKYIIEGLIYPSEIGMNYGQSGSMKSLHMLYKAFCIARGRKYLDKYKVKKQNVCILSAENSKKTDKDRIRRIMGGLKIRKKDIPLFILPREQCGDILNPSFKQKILDYVDEKRITAFFIDTINPVTPEIDDNKAKDVTRVFNEILKALSDKGCYVEFLHHTDKQGNHFLGSTKWKANCDAVTRIDRKGLEPSFTLYNEKNREGETNTLEIEIKFFENEIYFNLVKESSPAIYKKCKGKNKTELQKEHILNNLNKPMSRKELIEVLKEKKQLESTATLDRVIRELQGIKINNENGVYSKI